MSFLRPCVEREETNVGHNVKIDFQQEPFFHQIVKEGRELVWMRVCEAEMWKLTIVRPFEFWVTTYCQRFVFFSFFRYFLLWCRICSAELRNVSSGNTDPSKLIRIWQMENILDTIMLCTYIFEKSGLIYAFQAGCKISEG